jgi:hypothetical protein
LYCLEYIPIRRCQNVMCHCSQSKEPQMLRLEYSNKRCMQIGDNKEKIHIISRTRLRKIINQEPVFGTPQLISCAGKASAAKTSHDVRPYNS